MGAIQGSINQALGAVAGAAIAGTHAKEREFTSAASAESQSLVAQGQAQEATDKANKAYYSAKKKGGLVEQLADARVSYDMASEALDKAASRKNASFATVLEKRSQAREAKKAFDALQSEYDSVISMLQRADKMREHATKMTEMSDARKASYSRHWGGKI